MQTTSDCPVSPWLRPEFARLLAIFWVVGLALVYLVRYGAWVLPWQGASLFGATLPALHIGPHFQEFWTARAYDFACVIGIIAAALGLGVTVTNRLVVKRDILGALLALAVGFWLLAVLTLMAGAVFIAKIPLVSLTLLCWLLPASRKYFRDFQVSTDPTDGWAKLMIVCIVIAAVFNLVGALAPPFEYDELEYHLGALADYQRGGHILFLSPQFLFKSTATDRDVVPAGNDTDLRYRGETAALGVWSARRVGGLRRDATVVVDAYCGLDGGGVILLRAVRPGSGSNGAD
jgi:hypothetical protein